MPVEIRELIIRAITTSTSEDGEKPSQAQSSAMDNEAIIQECVRQVISILKKKEER